MDTGQNQKVNSDIDAATRLAAATRQLTLSPVHANVIPDDIPDELLANQRIMQGPIANIPIDAEVTLTAVQIRVHDRSNHRLALAVSIGVMSMLGCIVFIAFTSR